MIEKILSVLASGAFREFFSALFNFWANKKALDAAKTTGWTEAHSLELENILKDNLTAQKLEERVRDAQKPPTVDALNDWLLDKRAGHKDNNRNKS